jgi:hypothetical protein
MSETTTAAPTAELSLADALDAGIDAMDKSPAETPLKKQTQFQTQILSMF